MTVVHWAVFLIVCAIVWAINQALTARRARVQTNAEPSPLLENLRRCGLAPQAAPQVLFPPAGNWCGCCGRPAPDTATWCWACLDHVDAEAARPEDATWYAQHGTLCPFTNLDDDDIVPEGLGPTVMRRPHSVVSPSAQWSATDRALWDEIRQREARHERGAP